MKNNTKIIQQSLKDVKPFQSILKSFDNPEHFLIQNLPKSIRRTRFKAEKSKIRSNSAYAIHHFPFIGYNKQNRISMILLDFDKISSSENIIDRFPTIDYFKTYFLDDYFDDVNIVTKTSRGYQVLIAFNTHILRSQTKAWNLLSYIKAGICEKVPYIDEIATKRITGLMRNPLKHEHKLFSSEGIELSSLRHFAPTLNHGMEVHQTAMKASPEKSFKGSGNLKYWVKKILLTQLDADEYEEFKVPEGFRKTVLFHVAMIQAKHIKMDADLYNYLSARNYFLVGLDESEVEDVFKSTIRYKRRGALFVSDPRIEVTHSRVAKNKRYYRRHKKRVHGVKKSQKKHLDLIASKKNEKSLKKLKKALTRDRILVNCKKKNGFWNASALARLLNMGRRTVTKNLRILRKWINKMSKKQVREFFNKMTLVEGMSIPEAYQLLPRDVKERMKADGVIIE